MHSSVLHRGPALAPHFSVEGKWWWTGTEWLATGRQHRNRWSPAAVTKLVWLGLAILVVSSVLLALGWSHTRGTMHQVSGLNASRIELTEGTYWIYQDPGGDAYYPFPPGWITVSGPGGSRKVTATSYVIQPDAVASPFMGTGLFAPVASFTATKPGTYAVTIPRMPYNDKVFVGTTYGSALIAVGPWTIGCVTGLALTTWGLLVLRSKRRTLPLTLA